MSTANREPCLSFDSCSSAGPTSFHVGHQVSTDWESLKSMPSVSSICVYDHNQVDMEQLLLQLALALKGKCGIQKLYFQHCRLLELGHLMVAAHDPHGPPLCLRFNDCDISRQAAKTIQHMLRSDSIEELSFEYCTFAGSSEHSNEIQLALLFKSQNLRKFECWFESMRSGTTLINWIPYMLNTKANLLHFGVTVLDGDDDFWVDFRTTNDNKTLETLHFHRTEIEISPMETILMKCFVISSLQELGFYKCRFSESALDLLCKALSNNNHNHHVLDTLFLDQACFNEDYDNDRPLNVSFGTVNVRKLCLKDTFFEPQALSTMMNDIANNPFIQCLHMTYGFDNSEELRQLCNVVLRQNRGPKELIFDEITETYAIEIANAMQLNSVVKTLAIGNLEDSALVHFAQALANMNGVHDLTIDLDADDDDTMEEFCQELVRSLEQNTTLETLTLSGLGKNVDCVSRYLSQIRYFLAINRIRRHSLMAESVPNAIWAHVLAKTSEETAGINFVLREKPEIFALSTNRKRKSRDDE